MKKDGPNREWFYQKYVVEGKSGYDIARELKIRDSVVFYRLHSFNIPIRKQSEAIMGDRHPNWKGGRRSNNGYIRIYAPSHPCADSHKTVYEHRLVMEKKLGRYLTDKEVVHHLNGIKTDNREENLMVMLNNEHSKREGSLKRAMQYRIRELEKKVENRGI